MEKFSYEANGYNRNEVNQFISDDKRAVPFANMIYFKTEETQGN